MRQDTASLDRLHDIVVPARVPWWPPAPGWWFVLAALVLAAGWLAWRAARRYRRDAYRRAALRELEVAQDAREIAELLRRTALAFAPRATVVEGTGDAWVDWLGERWGKGVPADVRTALTEGVYRPAAGGAPLDALRGFAREWIRGHEASAGGGPC